MHVKVNSVQVVEMNMLLGLKGAWSATLQADGGNSIDGAVTISIGDTMEFNASTSRSGVHLDRVRLRAVAGANGLDVACGGKTYYYAPLRSILNDLLAVGGENISSLSDSSLLSTAPKHWARAKGTVLRELEVLADRFSFSWRAMPDGTFWFGSETWDESPLKNYTLIEDAKEDGRVVISSDLPIVLPGETFLERQVSEVEHVLSGGKLRTTVSFV